MNGLIDKYKNLLKEFGSTLSNDLVEDLDRFEKELESIKEKMHSIARGEEDSRLKRLYEAEKELRIKAEDDLFLLRQVWGDFKRYMEHQYPPKEGKEFEFSCNYFKEIDEILNS